MKTIIKIFVSFFIFIFSVYPKTYIVSENNGDYSNIQDAVNIAVAGDTILVREKSTPYFEKVHFIHSGNQTDGYITLKAYPNEHPIIDGTGLNLGSDWIVGLVKIINKSYIVVDGFEIQNLVTDDGSKFPAGIWVRGNSSHIKILNNVIHNIKHNNPDAGAHGLAFYGTNSSQSMNDLLIVGNEIYNCTLAWSESLVLNGNVEYFIVKDNVVHDNDNIAFDFIGFEGTCADEEFDQARNGLVCDNIAYNIDSRINPAYQGSGSADGFYVDGGKEIIFERNLAYNCNIGFELASEHYGKTTSEIIVRDNFVLNNNAVGIAIGGYDNERGNTKNCKIVNNTFYHNRSSDFDWGSEIEISYYCYDNIFKNNIIYSTSSNPLVNYNNSTGNNFTFGNNLYFSEGTPKWIWEGSSYYNLTDFSNASGWDLTSLFGNPLLAEDSIANNSPAISLGSPAIDSGENLDSLIVGSTDFAGNNRIYNNVIDIGAFEFQRTNGIGDSKIMPEHFKLLPAYPNPFYLKSDSGSGAFTSINFVLDKSQLGKSISLNIYSAAGLLIKQVYSGTSHKTEYSISWDGKNSENQFVSDGIYFAELIIGNLARTDKIIFIK